MEREDLEKKTIEYLDGLFGAGMGERHNRFLQTIDSQVLRDTLHAYHALEADTRQIPVHLNYLIGMAVLCATKSYGTASMFAKTLMHLGVPKAHILEVVARLSMWVGGVAAVEAAIHVQRAIKEYETRGLASMEAWFPAGAAPAPPAEGQR
jgi:hypothetical protein